MKKPLGAIYPVLKNKYYFDELYDTLFVRPSIWISDVFTSQWMDRGAIDGFLHKVAESASYIGSFFREYIDKPIVNGSGDLVADITKKLGQTFRTVQTGRVQQYMILALVTMAAFSALFYYLLVSPR